MDLLFTHSAKIHYELPTVSFPDPGCSGSGNETGAPTVRVVNNFKPLDSLLSAPLVVYESGFTHP